MIDLSDTAVAGKKAVLMRFRSLADSLAFSAFLFLLAVVVIIINDYVTGTLVFALITAILLLLCDDIVTIFHPVVLLMAFAIQAKNSFDDYMQPRTFIIGGFLIFSIFFHVIYYRKQYSFRKGELFLPILLVSVTCLLGGVGHLSVAEYFRFISVNYMFCLGFLVLLIYLLVGAKVQPGKNGTKPMDERISLVFCSVVGFLIVAILEYYAEHWTEFMEHPGILAFQWRNNACTWLMIGLPFTFYMAYRKHWAYYFLSFGSFGAFVLSGSRGGLLFGTLELIMLIIYFAVHDKRHRKLLIVIVSVSVLALLISLPKLIPFMSYTLNRFSLASGESSIRLGLWKRSVSDFLSSPINGRGLGYMGNRDIHASSIATLCWYHSSIPQVIGSFGILGILTYGYQFYKRLKLFSQRHSLFSRTVLWSFVGLELMSLVNPGIFAPNYLIVMTILFVVVENYEFPSMKEDVY